MADLTEKRLTLQSCILGTELLNVPLTLSQPLRKSMGCHTYMIYWSTGKKSCSSLADTA